LGGLYALRWPLLEGLIVSKIRQGVLSALQSDVAIEHLSGTLVSSIRGRDIDLRPHPGSPLRSAHVDRLDVTYGFLGASGLRLRVRGLRVELAPLEKPPAPLHETIREAMAALETTSLPARIEIDQATIVPPGGAAIEIEKARLEGGELTAVLRNDALGRVDLGATRGPKYLLRLRARASQGPVS